MIQLILHLIGDYLTQSDWMAQNKTKAYFPAFVHALLYSLPFLCLTTHIPALLCIFGTHLLIDRFRLARYLVWAKNRIGLLNDVYEESWARCLSRLRMEGREIPDACTKKELDELDALRIRLPGLKPWKECAATGYDPDLPIWLATWLLIIADNTLHLAINYAALRWL